MLPPSHDPKSQKLTLSVGDRPCQGGLEGKWRAIISISTASPKQTPRLKGLATGFTTLSEYFVWNLSSSSDTYNYQLHQLPHHGHHIGPQGQVPPVVGKSIQSTACTLVIMPPSLSKTHEVDRIVRERKKLLFPWRE